MGAAMRVRLIDKYASLLDLCIDLQRLIDTACKTENQRDDLDEKIESLKSMTEDALFSLNHWYESMIL